MIGDLFQHTVQCARLFADGSHLDRHGREQAAGEHGLIQWQAGGYIVSHMFDCLFERL